MKYQVYKSKPLEDIWSTQLVGSQYKSVLEQPNDKIIYHYSQHCHGCKKFGGKYEILAKNKHIFDNLEFYRIDNDKNKAEGVRNFNSTPVFAYYKQNNPNPFLYRMPIFTSDLFSSFLTITGNVKIIDSQLFNKTI